MLGKRQPFPLRPEREHKLRGRKQHQWSPAFLRDLLGPGQGRGTWRRKSLLVTMRGSSKKQEEGIIGGDASLDETGYSPRGLAGSRWFGMVKAFRKESGIAAGQKRKAAKAAASWKPAKNVPIQTRFRRTRIKKNVSQVLGGVSVFVGTACPAHLPVSRALPTRCQYRSTPLHIRFEEGEKGMVKTFQTYLCLKMWFQIDVCL